MVGMKALEASSFFLLWYLPPVRHSVRNVGTREDYHAIVTTNVPVKRLRARLKGNIEKFTGGANVTARKRCGGHSK
jgi:hypothetical protein